MRSMADAALLALRLAIAPSFLVHGLEKRKSWHEKPHGRNTRTILRTYRLLSVAEPLAGAAIATGTLTRWAAGGMAVVMAGAIRTRIAVWHNDFGSDDGWEIDWILFGASAALALLGGGEWSVDGLSDN